MKFYLHISKSPNHHIIKSTISIQKATSAETSIIAAIGENSFLESHGHSAPPADIASYVARKYSIEAIEAELANPENIYHIIFVNQKPAGYSKIIFNTPHPLGSPENCTKLERLYLLKEFYDLKLGLKLFDFILDLSKTAGQTGMWLYVWIENQRAVNFYIRSGFKIIGHADFPISQTHSNPNYLMFLKF